MVAASSLEKGLAGNAGYPSECKQVHRLLDATRAGYHGGICQHVVRTGGNAGLHARLTKRAAHHLALALVLVNQIGIEGLGQLLQSGGCSVLERGWRTDVREVVEVIDRRSPAGGSVNKPDAPASYAE